VSHISKIELEIQDLQVLRQACAELGLTFKENQKTYRWYGKYVGDTPLPEGTKVEDLGKCDHAIRVPGAAYEIGVVQRNGRHILLWDSWHAGGLERVLGRNAGRLKQAYAVARVRQQAARGNYRLRRQQLADGTIQLTLSR